MKTSRLSKSTVLVSRNIGKVSAAMIASAMMGGSALALVFDGSGSPYTVNGTVPDATGMTVTGNSVINGLNNDSSIDRLDTTGGGNFNLQSGTIYQVGLIGTGSLIKTTEGKVTLVGNNEYTGETRIEAGTLELGDGTLSATVYYTSGITVVSGTLAINLGHTDLVTSNITLEAGGTIVGVSESLVTNTLSGAISGEGGVIQNGVGFLLLEGENTYSGATIVNSGMLGLHDVGAGSAQSAYYVMESGTLAIYYNQDLGSLSGGGTLATTAAVLTIGEKGDGDFSGQIKGAISLIKTGSGTQILSGTNSYEGTTVVNEGVLAIMGNGSIADSASVTVEADGTLRVGLNDGNVFSNDVTNHGVFNLAPTAGMTNTITGIIDGTGDLSKTGSGRTILTGNNTYSGDTIVKDGTLQIGDGIIANASIGSSNLVEVQEGATLAIKLANGENFANSVENDGTVLSSVGVGVNHLTSWISGNGAFVKEGLGMTVFNSVSGHSYYGDTTIAEGTLRTAMFGNLSDESNHYVATGATLDLDGYWQEVGMLTGGGLVDLGSGAAALYISDYTNASGTFSGTITGQGDVVKYGSGTWALTGDSDFDGTLWVNEGDVALFGSVAGDAQIHGRLYGTGHVGGGLYNSGGIIIGGDLGKPGKLTAGTFVQDANGTYIVQIASKKKHSRIEVDGSAYLDGTVTLNPVAKYQPKRNDQLTILSADEGVHGKFSELVDLFPETMLSANLVYEDDAVLIRFEQEKFAKLSGLTPNQKSVAKGLDKEIEKNNVNKLADKLNVLSLDEVRNALALISPEQLAIIFNIGFASAQQQSVNIERRLDDVRRGSTGFSANGLALSNSHGTLNYDGAPILNEKDGLSLAGFDGKSIVGKQTVAPIVEESRWGFFATGNGEWADVESTQNVRGSEFRTGGVNVGADYRVNRNLVVGITGGYSNTSSDLFGGGKVDVNSGRIALYSTWFADGFYVNGLAGGAYNSYDTRRATYGGKAHASPDGGEFDALLGGGYDFKFGGFTVGPVASVQYTYLQVNSFSESGSDAPLHFPSQHQDSLKSLLGLKASYTFDLCGVAITPEVRVQWQHEYLDSTAAMESSFTSGGTIFSVDGPNIGRDGVLIDAGLSARINENLSVFAYYTGDYGRSNYTSNSVNGGFRVNF